MRHPVLSRLAILIAAALAAGAVSAGAPARAQGADASGLLAAEDARFQAELTHDAAALRRSTADDVVYSHFNGKREDKAGVLQTFTHLPLRSITPSSRQARVIGDVGIVRGQVVRQLGERTLSDGYLAVYARRAGRWQLIEWVSASAPPASGVPAAATQAGKEGAR